MGGAVYHICHATHLHFFQHFKELCRLKNKQKINHLPVWNRNEVNLRNSDLDMDFKYPPNFQSGVLVLTHLQVHQGQRGQK